jgi:hypothetical protein
MSKEIIRVLIMGSLVLGMNSCAPVPTTIAGGGTDTEVSILAGNVMQNGAPVADATVIVDDNQRLSGRTDSSGDFTISGVPYGQHSIYVYKDVPGQGKFECYSTVTVSGRTTDIGPLSLQSSMPAKRAK